MPRNSSAIAVSGLNPPTRLFAGTSGWAYPTWKPAFYPEGLSAKKLLSFYSTQLNSVEVNYTFTKLPTPAIVDAWLSQTPPDFRFSFKAPQRITHYSRLVDCNQHVADFLASIAPVVDARKSGLILFQLPPNFKANLSRLKDFLQLPALASAPPIAFEFRHESWFAPGTTGLLATLLTQHNAALCIAETQDFQTPELHTAVSHTSFRLRHTGGYSPREIASFAQRLTALARDRDVYAYFKHEDEPTGALNAAAFLEASARIASQGAGK